MAAWALRRETLVRLVWLLGIPDCDCDCDCGVGVGGEFEVVGLSEDADYVIV